MKAVYIFHSDPGHGWLAVPLKDLYLLGIQGDISSYSYVNGKTVYLEEDMDAGTFMKAYIAREGCEPPCIHGKVYDTDHPIRRYRSYVSTTGVPRAIMSGAAL